MPRQIFESGVKWFLDFPYSDKEYAKLRGTMGETRVIGPGIDDDLSPEPGFFRVFGDNEDQINRDVTRALSNQSQIAIPDVKGIVDSATVVDIGMANLYQVFTEGFKAVPADRFANVCDKYGLESKYPSRAVALSRAVRVIDSINAQAESRGRGHSSWQLINKTPELVDGVLFFKAMGNVSLKSSFTQDAKDDLDWANATECDPEVMRLITEAYCKNREFTRENGKKSYAMLSANEVTLWKKAQLDRLSPVASKRTRQFFPLTAKSKLEKVQAVLRESRGGEMTIQPVNTRTSADTFRDILVSNVEEIVEKLNLARNELASATNQKEIEKAGKNALKFLSMAKDLSEATEKGLSTPLDRLNGVLKGLRQQIRTIDGEIERQNVCKAIQDFTDPQIGFFQGVLAETLKENNVSDVGIMEPEDDYSDYRPLELD